MSATTELVYDPDSVFAMEFSKPMCAADLAFALSCREVNVLAGQLAHHGWHESAELWLTHHASACDDPRRHQN